MKIMLKFKNGAGPQEAKFRFCQMGDWRNGIRIALKTQRETIRVQIPYRLGIKSHLHVVILFLLTGRRSRIEKWYLAVFISRKTKVQVLLLLPFWFYCAEVATQTWNLRYDFKSEKVRPQCARIIAVNQLCYCFASLELRSKFVKNVKQDCYCSQTIMSGRWTQSLWRA